jgi:hypothetical protein
MSWSRVETVPFDVEIHNYAVFLIDLGFLDVGSEGPSPPPSLSSTASSLPSIQLIIKFQSPSATNGLIPRGWLSWYTVALPIDAPGVPR